MYNPRHFEEPRLDVIQGVIRANPFGTLVTNGADGLIATHLPFLIDTTHPSGGEFGVLRGHMARANRQWRDFVDLEGETRDQALVIFQGPHAYISPSWYAAAEAVPTWNYVAVHAYGRPSIIEAPAAAFALLRDLTANFEAPFEPPWTADGLSESYIESMVKAIVAFEIPIARLEGKAKMSQNRPQDQVNVADTLEASRDPMAIAVAGEIRDRVGAQG